MKMSFHGSRGLADERIRIIILEEIEKNKPDYIVTHGEPDGVCGLVRKIAQEKAIPLVLHFLNFKFLRGAFEHRSKAVLRDCDYCVFIHDGESKGTRNELKLAEKMGKQYSFHELEKVEYKKSVGFEILTDWELDTIDINKMITTELN